MAKYSKYVNALFFGAGALVWLISQHYIETLLGYFQVGRSSALLRDVIFHLGPIFLGFLTFVILRKNNKSYNFCTDAVGDLVRVTWPTAKDTRIGTIVVIVTVLLTGVFLAVVDYAFNGVVGALIGA